MLGHSDKMATIEIVLGGFSIFKLNKRVARMEPETFIHVISLESKIEDFKSFFVFVCVIFFGVGGVNS